MGTRRRRPEGGGATGGPETIRSDGPLHPGPLHPGPPDPTPALRVSPDGVMVRMGAGTPEDQRPEDQRMGDGTASGPDTVAGRDAACGGVAPEGMTEGDATGAILCRRTCARPGPGEPPDGDPPDGVRPMGSVQRGRPQETDRRPHDITPWGVAPP